MIRKTRLPFFAAALAICTAACSAVSRAIDRFVAFLVALVPASPARFATAGPALARSIDRPSLDPALRQRMRHEAGMSRRAAPRHI